MAAETDDVPGRSRALRDRPGPPPTVRRPDHPPRRPARSAHAARPGLSGGPPKLVGAAMNESTPIAAVTNARQPDEIDRFDPERFYRDHWRRRPFVLRGCGGNF